MKKNIIFLIFILFSFFQPAFAGVVQTKHDMYAQQKGTAQTKHDMYSSGKGTDPNVCSYCHIPHNAAGDKIWSFFANEAQLKNGPSTPIGNMCYTCHDGTVTYLGLYSVFSPYVQNHKIPPGEDCTLCHSVHDNTNGEFMKVAMVQDSYCAACHNAEQNAGGWGDHTGPGNHPSYWTEKPPHNTGVQGCTHCHGGNGNTGSCNLCHETGHGAAKFSTPEVSHPILRDDNTDSAYCASCHLVNRQHQRDGFKHPTILDSPGSWGKVECEACHDPHQPDKPQNVHILREQNTDSSYCTRCHDESNETNGPKIGDGHPVNIPFADEPADPGKSPAGNTIDDDDYYGPDYPANSSNIVCETCHAVHRKGEAVPLLRLTTENSALCINCHTDM